MNVDFNSFTVRQESCGSAMLVKKVLLGQLMALLMSIRYITLSILTDVYSIKIRAGLMLVTYLFLFVTSALWLLCISVDINQANYTKVFAMGYTSLISVQLLSCFAIPVVLLLSWFYLKSRYQLPHILGLVCGVMSVVVILWTDVQDGKGGVTAGGGDRMTGDSIALLSAALSGVMQVISVHLADISSYSEYLAIMGLSGSCISASQVLIFERREVASIPWAAAPQVAVMLTLVLSQIIFYLLFPVSVQMLHPAGLNLSLLSANFITLGAAVAIFMYKFNLMYLAGVALICVGNLAFYWRPVLSLEDLSSLIGSSGSSGDTEVSSDTGSCNAVQLDMTPASALVPGSPPYHLQFHNTFTSNNQRITNLDAEQADSFSPRMTRVEYCK